MVENRDVAIIGGGFAGLSAGVALADRGFRVALLEGKPRLGGRAYSMVDPETGDFVDNGQHVLMGCYGETLAFLSRIGARDKLIFHQNLEIEMLERGEGGARLRTARLPGPFHMSTALLRYRHLGIRDRIGLITGGLRLRAMHRRDRASLEQMTVAALMGVLGQSERARRCFWYPLAIATLNEDPALASAALLAEVLNRAFFGRRSDSAFVYPRVGLSDLYCTAAAKFIEDRGGVVATHTMAEALEFNEDSRIAAIQLRDGRRLEAANFIAAVPPSQLSRLLPESANADPFFARFAELGSSPIICVHAWLNREVTDSPFVGFIGTTTQWLFNKRRIFTQHGERHPGYLSFVISGARKLVDLPNEDLLDLVMGDLRTMIRTAGGAKLVKALVLKEKQATIAPDPQSHKLRPSTATPLPNLFLAGDWVQTGLPATIESAVMSGHAAASSVAARVNETAPA